MINVSKANIVCLGLFGLGVVAWQGAGSSLRHEGFLKITEPNVLTLKGSPFGKTIAMAMQGPVDVFWHEGESHDHVHLPGESCSDGCNGHHGEELTGQEELPAPVDGATVTITTGEKSHDACADGDCDHDHGHVAEHGHSHAPGESCDGCGSPEAEAPVEEIPGTVAAVRGSLLDRIKDWRAVANTRHNPHANNKAHKYFIRREVEEKLMLTYRMDPTNYASYGAYFLFLSESSLSDRAESMNQALRLSQATIQFCSAEKESATALLTGAAAAHDAAQLILASGNEALMPHVEGYMKVSEEFLEGFEHVALQMAFDGTWENFSVYRQNEMTERARLLRKLVESNQQIQRSNANHKEDGNSVSAG